MLARSSVYVFASAVLPGVACAQVLNDSCKLYPDNPGASDYFGHSTAMEDGVVGVGAHFGLSDGDSGGFVSLLDVMTCAEIMRLVPDDGEPANRFGSSVAMRDGFVAVGAYGDSDNGFLSGSAYLFDAITGAQIHKFLPDDGAEGQAFGWSIAVADGVVAVGSPQDFGYADDGTGLVYLFDAATGVQLDKLVASDAEIGDLFGWSVSMADGIVAVGAPRDDDNGLNSGSAYLYDASTGAELGKLLLKDGGQHNGFGGSITIANGIVGVGAPNYSVRGAVALFDAESRNQFAMLLALDREIGDNFGNSLAIADGVVAVGAYWADGNGSNSGSAYLFDAETGVQLAKLTPEDNAGEDRFGTSVAMSNGVIAAGAPMDTQNGDRSGSAYLFKSFPCSAADTAEPFRILDFSDVAAFLSALSDTAPIADLSEPRGVFDFSDVFAFLGLFGAGCP